MQYWINHNGVQSGPVDLDALKEMGLTSSAYVWHEGLTDWVKITQLPELQGLYEMVGGNQQPQTADDQPTVGIAMAEPVQDAEQPVEVGEPYQAEPVPEPYQPQPEPQPYQPEQPYQPQYAEQQPAPAEPCPPTNLVWAIISTVLCCLPAGVVAIVYAIKVTNKYREGDIEGAKRASETGAWWCIASIILGIICQPIMSAFSLLPWMN
jgi:hypothetical protein